MKKLEKYKLNKYVLYAICFWLFIGPLIYKISKLGLATFGGWDAITQTYQVMLYTSQLVKEFISALLGDGSFTFPMIEWNLGMGDDVIVALNWYGFGDPSCFNEYWVYPADSEKPKNAGTVEMGCYWK
jgi:hypothetical protein